MDAFGHLSRLSHLVDLHFVFVNIDFTTKVLLPTVQFPSVRSLNLVISLLSAAADSVGLQFCRTFAAMFPNLYQLYIFNCYTKTNIESHLGLFGKLRKHLVNYE